MTTPAATGGAAAPWVVLLAGVSAALHVGKLPPALPALQAELGLSLVQSGFLLSLVQLASMLLGLVAGLLAEGVGLKRCMVVGLGLLTAAALAGAAVHDAAGLLALRAAEGFGFLLVTVPAPSLMRRCVAPASITRMLGFWGAFMPIGTALALLAGPFVIGSQGWPRWWALTALLSLVMAVCVQRWVMPDAAAALRRAADGEPWRRRLARTLGAAGPWLGALTFGLYSAQWLAVIGFLPTLYQQSGWGGARGAVLTAVVAAANIIGNVAAGRLLHRGVAPQYLLWAGFGAMAVGAFAAFGALTADHALLRYTGALLFSALGGLIPGTLFAQAPRLAPSERTIATTVGWFQQCSAIGQVSGPPLVAWVASQHGGWDWAWAVTGACCVGGALLAAALARRLSRAAAV